MSTMDRTRNHEAGAARRTLVVLVLLTGVALLLTTHVAQDLASVRILSAIAAALAFVKARFVALDFMDLRDTALQRVMDVWLAVVGLASVALLLR